MTGNLTPPQLGKTTNWNLTSINTQVLAEVCALVMGAKADTGIVQITRVFHTGADPMERINLRAQFEGAVVPNGQYVLIDDVTSLGGTLAELARKEVRP